LAQWAYARPFNGGKKGGKTKGKAVPLSPTTTSFSASRTFGLITTAAHHSAQHAWISSRIERITSVRLIAAFPRWIISVRWVGGIVSDLEKYTLPL
jgi:hypothetical protein